jgi:hypothetical protein
VNRLLSFNPEARKLVSSVQYHKRRLREGEGIGIRRARGRNLRFRKPSASSVRQAPIRADRRAVLGPPTPFTTPALVTSPAEQTLQRAVYGWSPYKRPAGALPPDKQAVLKGVGDAMIASYGPGGQPVANAIRHAPQPTRLGEGDHRLAQVLCRRHRTCRSARKSGYRNSAM